MDVQTDIKRALVVGASGGIGRAVIARLQERGTEVQALSRSVDALDVTLESSVARHLGAQEGTFDLILVATGALDIEGMEPEKSLSALAPEAMARQFALNTIGPAMVLKHSLPLVPRDRRSVIAVLSARVGSIGDNRLGGWHSYRVAKAGVNQVVRTAAVELARTHRHAICVALHPGTVATKFTAKYAGRHPTVAPEEAATHLLRVIDGLEPVQTGGFYDWAGKEVPW